MPSQRPGYQSRRGGQSYSFQRRFDLEQRLETFGWTRDNRSATTHYYRPLHQLGMFEQQPYDRFGGRVIGLAELKLLEATILSHQLCRRNVKHRKNSLQRCAVERMLEIFDGVELDTTGPHQFERAARLASSRVVIKGQFVHLTAPGGTFLAPQFASA